MELITTLWNNLFFQPMLNLLVFLSATFGGNFGLTIILFTIMIRLVMLPLFIQQMNSSKAQQQLQPLLAKAKEKYKSDQTAYQQEVQRIYAEYGINPLSGCLPSVIQMPIWIGLYNSITAALGDQPEQLLNLAPYLYNVEQIARAVPFQTGFLWLNLAHPDAFYILPILVGATGWLQAQMMPKPTDPQAAQTAQAMQFMPLMFAFFTLQVPSGLALYWVTSNIISVAMQYFTNRLPVPVLVPKNQPVTATAGIAGSTQAEVVAAKPVKASKATNGNGNGIAMEPVGEVEVVVATAGGNGTAASTNGRKAQTVRRPVRPKRRSS